MTVLVGTKRWKKKRTLLKERSTHAAGILTPEETACCRVALRVLQVRAGSLAKLAKQMNVSLGTLNFAARPRNPFGTGMAYELSKVAGVPIDDILSGRFPKPGSCPHCGRTDEADAPKAKG
jgi:hypothetical protein